MAQQMYRMWVEVVYVVHEACTHQPDEAAQDEGEHITDLDAQLPGRSHDDGVSALSPAQVGLLGLQVVDDGSQVG